MFKFIGHITLLLILGSASNWAENLITQSQQHCLHKMAQEGNFSLQEAMLLHGNLDVKSQSAPLVFQSLIEGGYLSGIQYCYGLISRLQWDESGEKFLVTTEPAQEALPQDLMLHALKTEPSDSVMLRGFLLETAENFSRENQTLLMQALFRDQELVLLPQYFIWALKHLENPVKILLKESTYNHHWKLQNQAKQQAQLFFLAFWFTDFKPKIPSTKLMASLFDLEVPLPALQVIFKAYPSDLLAEFVVPFKEGYGSHHRDLLQLFSKEYSHPKILQSLAFALINRNRGHFKPIQADILGVWEDMTKTRYLGSTHEFLKWYEEQKKRLKSQD